MSLIVFAMLLQTVLPAPPGLVPIPLRLGVRVIPDTVTIGQRFIVFMRVQGPAGATIEFPATTDSSAASPTTTQIVGRPVFASEAGAGTGIRTAAYRMIAWDTGPQSLMLGHIVARHNGQTGYVSLARYRVQVRSVLPLDSAQKAPKPPRELIPIEPFSRLPWLILFVLVMLAGLGWWLWQVYHRRRNEPADPFAAAELEFSRIDSLNLIAAGEGGRHVAMMVDTMRVYLALRIPEIELSQTSSELVAAAGRIGGLNPEMGGMLWRADLVKFAGHRPDRDEASATGSSARQLVRTVEAELVRREAEVQRLAEKRAA